MNFSSQKKWLNTVSVVIPFYNDSETISRVFISLESQSVSPLEVLVIDDASSSSETCRLHEIANRFQSLNIKVISLEENKGPSVARNIGWDAASGDFLAFLDADDAWHADKLKIQLSVFAKEPSLVLLGTKSTMGDSAKGDSVQEGEYQLVTPSAQLLRNRFSTSSVMIRRNLQNRFNNSFRYSEDNDLWCRLILSGGQSAAVVQSFLTYYFKPPRSRSGASGRFWRMYVGELGVYALLRQDGLITPKTMLLTLSSSTLRFAVRMFRVAYTDLREVGRRIR